MNRIYSKVALDMFIIQGTWAFGFMTILFFIQCGKIVLSLFNDKSVNTYFDSLFFTSNIFMLVVGIISAVGVLSHYVGNGVTRKDFFKGTMIGTIGLSFVMPIVGTIVSSLLNFIVKLINMQVEIKPYDGLINEPDGNIVSDIILSVIFTPYEDPMGNWLLAIFILAINMFTYYVAGWLIGAAFGRFGIFGILSIIFAFILIFIEDILISKGLGLPVSGFFQSTEVPLYLSIILTFALLFIYCWMVRLLTKRIIVKL